MFGNHEFTTPLLVKYKVVIKMSFYKYAPGTYQDPSKKSKPIFHKRVTLREKKSSEALKRRVVHLEIL